MLQPIKKYSIQAFGVLILTVLFGASTAVPQVTITFEISKPSPITMNIGEETFLRIDAYFSSNDFDEIFLSIPDKPEFFTFWRERQFEGPADYIYDKIIFKPMNNDGGQYFFKIIAGGIRNGEVVVSKTIDLEIRVKPYVLREPDFTGGTTNTIHWVENDNLFDQWIFLVDPNNPASPGKKLMSLGKKADDEIIETTFENLMHGVQYGFHVKGFTDDSTVVQSQTVFSVQDAIPPSFLDTSFGMEGPDGTVDLFWRTVPDEGSFVQGFVIFRRTAMGSFVAIDSVFANGEAPDDLFHKQDEREWGLVEGETYFYKIVGLDAGFNVGDGQELGPFIPDATPSPTSTFFWQPGFGFDFVPPTPHEPFPEQSDDELPWCKQGTSNTVYLFNPTGLPGFEGLAKADSVRFQAVRDKSTFFDVEWQPGMQFFDSWSSPWIPIDQFNGGMLFYTFDFTNDGANDEWFINGHFFKYRAQFKDIAGNRSEFSRFNQDSLFVGAFQDVFPPSDISNLNSFVKIDPTFSGGGFIRLDWEAAVDSVCGVKEYNIYRKIGEGEFVKIDSVKATTDPIQMYFDTFANIDTCVTVFYRIGPEDNVGNIRDFQTSFWETHERAPLPPKLTFANEFTLFNGTMYTTKNAVVVEWTVCDLEDVDGMTLTVNGQKIDVDPAALQAVVPLAEEANQIFANVQFSFGFESPNSDTLKIIRDSTPPGPVTLIVENDSSFTGNMFLNWNSSEDLLPVKYEIFRKEINGTGGSFSKTAKTFAFISIGETSDTLFTDPYINADGSFLIAFQHYEYKVLPTDLLGNMTEANAGFDSNYCNIAPEVTSMSFFADSIKITWKFPEFPDSSIVPFELTRFDIRLFQSECPVDLQNPPVLFRSEIVIDRNMITFGVDVGSVYGAVVRAVELQSGNLDSSAWSQSRCTDTGQSIIPVNEILLTQAQPTDSTGIFVSWEFYFDDPFWNVNQRELVGFFRVIRHRVDNAGEVLERDFGSDSSAYQNLMYMDRENLEPNAKYVYQVIPFEKKVNDPPRFLPAGNDSATVKNDTSNVTNFTDRVFIPKFTGPQKVNPATGKKYFNVNTADSLRLEWSWFFEENGTSVEADTGNTRGAESVKVFISNNQDFINRPDFKQFTEIIELRKNMLTSIEQFYYTSTNDLTNPDLFNIYEGKSVFAKIMGFERWDNSDSYPSSADLDGVTELINDNTLPSPSSLEFKITSSNDTTTGMILVDIDFSWPKSTDNLSGVRDYEIQIFQKNNGSETVVDNIPNIPGADSSFVLEKFEILDEYFTQPLFFRIIPRDFADNSNSSGNVTDFKFFSPPELQMVERDSITNKVTITWTKVQAVDKYLLVFANKKSFFLSPGLQDNPGNREIITAKASDPDVITKRISRIFTPDSTWFFRMLGIKDDIFQSGWSNFVELPPSNQISGGNNITDVTKELEIPTSFVLHQNYPNPFNPETIIGYDLPNRTQVEITIYNLAGKKIRTLVNGEQDPGQYKVIWNGRDASNMLVASGVYLFMISTPEFNQVKKCLFLK